MIKNAQKENNMYEKLDLSKIEEKVSGASETASPKQSKKKSVTRQY
jgi:hypothetical protein